MFGILVFVSYSIMTLQIFSLTRFLYETNEHANFRSM